jgi:hypothetical protein
MATLYSYGDASRAEDVLDIVTNISPTETPLYSGLKRRADAQNTLHEFLTDSLGAAADNAPLEGSDPTYPTLTQPSRVNNVVQLFRKPYDVSDTQRAIEHYGMSDPFSYQMQKSLKEFARDCELAIIRGTRASGNNSTARRLAGIIASVTTNATTLASNTTLTETIVNNLIDLSWDNTADVVDEFYCGAWVKRKISAFTAGTTKFTQAEDKRLVNAVDVYESDFGIHKIFKHRLLGQDSASNDMLLMVSSKYWGLAYLTGRSPKAIPLSKTGSSTKGMIEGEFTIEARAEAANVIAKGINPAG